MLVVVAALSGCGILDSDGDGWERDLAEARGLWSDAGLTDYRYHVRQLCFCAYGGQEVEVEVRDGAAVRGVLVATGEVLPQDQLEWSAPTVEHLFTRIEDILDRGPHEFTATYHPELGYPTFVTADPIENAIDEEWGVEADQLEELPPLI
jgi:hypothetical protein